MPVTVAKATVALPHAHRLALLAMKSSFAAIANNNNRNNLRANNRARPMRVCD